MASGPITSWQKDGYVMETVTDLIFLGCKFTVVGDCSHKIKNNNNNTCSLEKKNMTNLLSHFSHVQLLATPWTAAYQVPPSMGVSRQEDRSGSPVPSPT